MSAPEFWQDQQGAQKMLQRRKRLEGDLGFLTRLRGQEDDTRVLVEWMEARRRRGEGPRRRPGRPRRRRSRPPSSRRCSGASTTAPTPSSPSTPARGARRARTGRRCCCACTCAGATATGYKRDITDIQAGEEAGIKSATVLVQRGIRLRLPLRGGRRAPAGAHQPLRLRGAAAHLVRLRLRLAGDRRGHQDRGPGQGPPRGHLPLQRRGRPARQRHRLRGAHHAHAQRHRRLLPERAQPDPQPRGRDEGPEVAPLRPGAAEAAGQARRGGVGEEGHRLRQPDPLLRPPSLPAGQGPSHQIRGRRREPRARRRHRRPHQHDAGRAGQGHAGPAAAAEEER